MVAGLSTHVRKDVSSIIGALQAYAEQDDSTVPLPALTQERLNTMGAILSALPDLPLALELPGALPYRHSEAFTSFMLRVVCSLLSVSAIQRRSLDTLLHPILSSLAERAGEAA